MSPPDNMRNGKVRIVQAQDEHRRCTGGLQRDFIDRPLRTLFSRLGKYIGRHPYPFLIIPLVISACLSLGLKYFEIETDTEYLVTPKNGPAKHERKIVDTYFSLDEVGGKKRFYEEFDFIMAYINIFY